MLYIAITTMASVGGTDIVASRRHMGAVPIASAWCVACGLDG